MVFCVCQLVEKAIEHNTKVFLLFVDLCKAYDTVSRTALWYALQKYGVPDVMIELIRSLHDEMFATVTVGGGRSKPFLVWNGSPQGCFIASTLFILYFGLVIDTWLGVGVKQQVWKCTLNWVGSWSESHVRDQTPLCCQSACLQMMLLWCAPVERIMVLAVKMFDEVAAGYGFTLSVPKTKPWDWTYCSWSVSNAAGWGYGGSGWTI